MYPWIYYQAVAGRQRGNPTGRAAKQRAIARGDNMNAHQVNTAQA